MHNTIHNPSYLILLRVESHPRDLWRSLHGNIYRLSTTRIEKTTAAPPPPLLSHRNGD